MAKGVGHLRKKEKVAPPETQHDSVLSKLNKIYLKRLGINIQTLISSRGIPLDGAIGSFAACKPFPI